MLCQSYYAASLSHNNLKEGFGMPSQNKACGGALYN